MERHNDVESFLIRFKEQVQRLLDLAIERNVVQSVRIYYVLLTLLNW